MAPKAKKRPRKRPGSRSYGAPPADTASKVEEAVAGYSIGVKPYRLALSLGDHYDLSAKYLADVLDVTPKTFSRWKGKSGALSVQQADRIQILKSLFDLGRQVLGSEENVKRWIREPVFYLDGEKPIDLLKTESGRRKVESVLHQIEYGYF